MPSLLNHGQLIAKRPRFWLGPFIAGCCFAFGYGLTGRIISIQADLPASEMFFLKDEPFPGISLKSINVDGDQLDESLKVKSVLIQDQAGTFGDDQNESNGARNHSSKEQKIISVINPLKPRFVFPVLPSLILEDFELNLFSGQMIIQRRLSSQFIRLKGISPIPFSIPQQHKSLR